MSGLNISNLVSIDSAGRSSNITENTKPNFVHDNILIADSNDADAWIAILTFFPLLSLSKTKLKFSTDLNRSL